MFKHSDISTQVAKGPFYFTLTALIVSILSVILLLTYSKNALAIFAVIMMSVVAIASSVVLFAMLSDYAYIKDDVLYMSYLFKKSQISLDRISKVKLLDDIYHVYDQKDDEIGSINGLALGIEKIVNKLDTSGVSFL